MNKYSFPVRTLAAGVAALMLAGFASQTQAQNATVISLHGTARFTDGQQAWQPLKRGAVLPPGTLIQTARKSNVELLLDAPAGMKQHLSDKNTFESAQPVATVVRIFPDTALMLDKLNDASGSQLNLAAGRIMAAVRQMAPPASHDVKFSGGLIGTRGGVYELTATGILDVLQGNAVIALAAPGNNGAKVVSAHHRFDPISGQVTDNFMAPAPMPAPTSAPAAAPAVNSDPAAGSGPKPISGQLRKF